MFREHTIDIGPKPRRMRLPEVPADTEEEMIPRALDLFCGAGGAGMGLFRAGFHVTGVDLHPQPNYPFRFHQADAMAAPVDYEKFDLIWASPPCQAYTRAQRIQANNHPDLIRVVRGLLRATGALYVIENVPDAPLIQPLVLCGQMFGLKTYRHRLFETSFPCEQMICTHTAPQAKMGRPPKDGEFIQVVGNFSNVEAGREAMGVDWMTRDELREAIPPAYAEFIGRAAMRHLRVAA